MDNYSLADIAAATGNEGFGGNSAWILVLLFAMIFGGGGFGYGRNDGYGQFATAASQQEILFGQQFQNLDNKMDRLGNGIADATFALNSAIKDGNAAVTGAVTTEGRALQMQLANCCCDIKTAIHSEGEATRGLIQQNKIEALQQKVSQLELQNAVCGVVRYPMQTTYTSGSNPFCGNGCGCGNV